MTNEELKIAAVEYIHYLKNGNYRKPKKDFNPSPEEMFFAGALFYKQHLKDVKLFKKLAHQLKESLKDKAQKKAAEQNRRRFWIGQTKIVTKEGSWIFLEAKTVDPGYTMPSDGNPWIEVVEVKRK